MCIKHHNLSYIHTYCAPNVFTEHQLGKTIRPVPRCKGPHTLPKEEVMTAQDKGMLWTLLT